MTERFDLRARAKSFVFAFRGLVALVRDEHNVRIHLAVGAAVVGMGAWLRVSRLEWAMLALAVGAVLVAEALNSALESLADAVHPGAHPAIARAKDVAAAAVLIAAVAAAAVGVCILGPPLFRAIVAG